MSHGEAQTPLQAIRGAGIGGRSGESTLHGDSLTKRTRFGPDGIGDAAGGVKALPTRFFQGDETSHADHQVWQDVYHGMTEDGIPVYIKITGFAGGRPPVIQFKAK